jgi:hypothetical protein
VALQTFEQPGATAVLSVVAMVMIVLKQVALGSSVCNLNIAWVSLPLPLLERALAMLLVRHDLHLLQRKLCTLFALWVAACIMCNSSPAGHTNKSTSSPLQVCGLPATPGTPCLAV